MTDFDKKPDSSEIDRLFSSLLEADGSDEGGNPQLEEVNPSDEASDSPHLFLVKPAEFETGLMETTGVWDCRKVDQNNATDTATVRTLGRILLSASGVTEIDELKARVETVLKREFRCSPEFIRPFQWGQIIRAVEWIADESAQYQDVVRLLTILSDMPAPLHLRVTLKLRASFYLEHRLADFEKALELALGAHALSPLSTQTAGVVFEKIRCAKNQITAEKTGGYWKRIINLYLDVLADRNLAKDKQVAVLLMLGWLFCDGMDDLERGCQCVARAKQLDPDNQAVAAKLAVMEAKCAESARVAGLGGVGCRPPVACPPIPATTKNKTYTA